MIRIRNEDMADEFLRKYDSYYKSTNKSKAKQEEYPYLSPSQEKYIYRRELVFSSLGKREIYNLQNKNYDVIWKKEEC